MQDLLNKVNEVNGEVTKLEGKQSLKSLTDKINELIDVVNKQPKPRDRGPASERQMNEDDARRIMMGDLKDESHKRCAEILGLSYGQIYSARNGYTFKVIYKESQEG